MSGFELIKEIKFNILESQEVDLMENQEQKKRKRKIDDYDYEDDFIEPFEGEDDLVDIECKLENFFVYKGEMRQSSKRIISTYRNRIKKKEQKTKEKTKEEVSEKKVFRANVNDDMKVQIEAAVGFSLDDEDEKVKQKVKRRRKVINKDKGDKNNDVQVDKINEDVQVKDKVDKNIDVQIGKNNIINELINNDTTHSNVSKPIKDISSNKKLVDDKTIMLIDDKTTSMSSPTNYKANKINRTYSLSPKTPASRVDFWDDMLYLKDAVIKRHPGLRSSIIRPVSPYKKLNKLKGQSCSYDDRLTSKLDDCLIVGEHPTSVFSSASDHIPKEKIKLDDELKTIQNDDKHHFNGQQNLLKMFGASSPLLVVKTNRPNEQKLRDDEMKQINELAKAAVEMSKLPSTKIKIKNLEQLKAETSKRNKITQIMANERDHKPNDNHVVLTSQGHSSNMNNLNMNDLNVNKLNNNNLNQNNLNMNSPVLHLNVNLSENVITIDEISSSPNAYLDYEISNNLLLSLSSKDVLKYYLKYKMKSLENNLENKITQVFFFYFNRISCDDNMEDYIINYSLLEKYLPHKSISNNDDYHNVHHLFEPEELENFERVVDEHLGRTMSLLEKIANDPRMYSNPKTFIGFTNDTFIKNCIVYFYLYCSKSMYKNLTYSKAYGHARVNVINIFSKDVSTAQFMRRFNIVLKQMIKEGDFSV